MLRLPPRRAARHRRGQLRQPALAAGGGGVSLPSPPALSRARERGESYLALLLCGESGEAPFSCRSAGTLWVKRDGEMRAAHALAAHSWTARLVTLSPCHPL